MHQPSSDSERINRERELVLRYKRANPPWKASPAAFGQRTRQRCDAPAVFGQRTYRSEAQSSISMFGSRFQEELTIHFGEKRAAGLYHRSCRDTMIQG
jgi:hypothetical protein